MTKKVQFDIVRKNNPDRSYLDVYHYLLKISWVQLFAFYILFFLGINAVFASIYMTVPGSLSENAREFKDAFFFSVQTFSTVGYGTISPNNLFGNIVAVFEIMIGVVTVAVTTGLVFSRFSKPSAKILYTKNLLHTHYDGENVLMFRMANTRSNQIISAKVELHYLYNSTTVEGQKIVRFSPLKLQKDYSPLFSLSWSVFHTIDQESPLFGKTPDEINQSNLEFMVVMNGTDGTFSQSIYDMHYYKAADIVFDKHFADILHRDENGTRVIDYDNFHKTI